MEEDGCPEEGGGCAVEREGIEEGEGVEEGEGAVVEGRGVAAEEDGCPREVERCGVVGDVSLVRSVLLFFVCEVGTEHAAEMAHLHLSWQWSCSNASGSLC